MLATLHPLWNTIEIPWEYGGSSSGNAVGKLVKVNSIMNKKVYHNILVHHGFVSGLKPIGHGFICQQWPRTYFETLQWLFDQEGGI